MDETGRAVALGTALQEAGKLAASIDFTRMDKRACYQALAKLGEVQSLLLQACDDLESPDSERNIKAANGLLPLIRRILSS